MPPAPAAHPAAAPALVLGPGGIAMPANWPPAPAMIGPAPPDHAPATQNALVVLGDAGPTLADLTSSHQNATTYNQGIYYGYIPTRQEALSGNWPGSNVAGDMPPTVDELATGRQRFHECLHYHGLPDYCACTIRPLSESRHHRIRTDCGQKSTYPGGAQSFQLRNC